MRLKTLLTIVSAFTLLYSCKKADTKDTDTQQIIKTQGKIKFPNGSNINPSGCTVNSYITEQVLIDDNYSVDTVSNDFNIQFLTSSNGKELMLGYTYPSQTDFTIDAKSTLLALVMKLPTVNSLTASGKINLINKIKSSPGYSDAITAIESHIISDKDIFDSTDIDMRQKITDLFDYAATHRQGFGYDGQVYVNVNKNEKTVTFGNPGVSIAQVIGIYQGGTRVAKLELERYKTFVTSITEIPSAINNPPSPIEVKYDFKNDGVYEIKIRSGGFNLPNNDLESDEAIVSNIINLTLDNIKVFIPIDLSKDCPKAVYDAIKSSVEVFKNAMKSSQNISTFLGISYNLTKKVIYTIIINTTCVSGNAGKIGYLEKISKILGYLDWFGKVGTTFNNSIFITDYFIATKSSLDTTITIGNIIPILTTSNVTTVAATTAITGGNITNDGGSSITARGVCWSTSGNPTINDTKTSDGVGPGSFVSNLTGLQPSTTYHLRAFASNSSGTGYGNDVSFTTLQDQGQDETFTDARDGQVYTYKQIGTQVWMTKNLNYKPQLCYNCEIYGGLYDWQTAMTVAPPGWHLPSDAEWTTLTTFLGGEIGAGRKMKSTTGWKYDNTGTTNSSGFTALPGGSYNSRDGTFDNVGQDGYWWSSTQISLNAWIRHMSWLDANVGRSFQSTQSGAGGFSIRCVKD